jgi:hypothetical protein
MSRHLAVADKQQAASAHTLLHPLDTRDIQGIISPLARYHIGGHRHPQRIENRLHHLDLRQIRAIIMAKLKSPLWAHTRIGARRRAVDVDALGAQVVHAHHVLIQAVFKLGWAGIVTELPQDNLKPIVGEIEPLDGLSTHRLKGIQAVDHPGLDMHEAVIASGQNGAEPDGADPAQTEPIPVAVGGKMGVDPRRQVHLLHLLEQQWNVVDALRDNMGYLIHTQSLTQSAIHLQI